MLIVFFYLLVGHALADYALQGDSMAINKNRHAKTELQKHVPWYYWMSAHALIHGGAVTLITQSLWLGLAETFCHFLIDYGKCNRLFNINIDQLLHLACKISWFLIYLKYCAI